MANFKQTVITKAAHNLIAKSLSGSANINFTRVATSKYDYKSFSQSKLESLTSLEDIKQYVAVDKVEKIGEASVNVSVKITNANITEGYYVNTIGLFAMDPEEGEILYSVTVAETADYFPADNGVNCSGINLDLVTEVSNASNVNITVNYAGYATNEDIEKVNSQLNDIVKYPKMQYTSNITTTILKSVSGGSANWTSPQWNVKKYDTNYFIENDNTLITIKQSGVYIINLAINLNVSNGANFSIKLIKNYGDTGVEEIAYESKLAASISTRINLCTTCYINQNETLKALIYHEGQSDVNLVCGHGFPMISVTKVGEMG